MVVNALFDELGKVVNISLSHVAGCHVFAQHLFGDGVKQQARRGVGVVWIFLDQGARSQNRGLVDLVHGHAVIQVAQGLGHDRVGLYIRAQTGTGGFNQALEPGQIEHDALATIQGMQLRCLGRFLGHLFGALLGAFFAVQHIGTGDLVMATAHQTQLNLVLHIFDVKSATARA